MDKTESSSSLLQHRFDELLYFGTGSTSRVLRALSVSVKDTVSINLVQDKTADTNSNPTTLPIDELSTLPHVLRGRDLLIVLDLTASNNVPGSKEFSSFYLQVLSFMKFVMTSKLHITGLWRSLHGRPLSTCTTKVLISF